MALVAVRIDDITGRGYKSRNNQKAYNKFKYRSAAGRLPYSSASTGPRTASGPCGFPIASREAPAGCFPYSRFLRGRLFSAGPPLAAGTIL